MVMSKQIMLSRADDGAIELHEDDYVLTDKVAWVVVKDLSIRIDGTTDDDVVKISAYKNGQEDRSPVFTAYVSPEGV